MAMEPPYELLILHVDPHERILLRHLYIPDGIDRSETDEPSKVNQLLSVLLSKVPTNGTNYGWTKSIP